MMEVVRPRTIDATAYVPRDAARGGRPELRAFYSVPMLADATPSACCQDTLALVIETLTAARCSTCGAEYFPAPDNDDAPDEGRSGVVPQRPAPLQLPPLAEVIADVQLAERWRREVRAGVGVASAGSPLAALQGRSSGASRDADAGTTGALWRLVTQPGSKVGRKAREGFVDSLVRYCEETSRPLAEDEPDWRRARELGARLALLAPAHRAALAALARRCGPAVGWDVAALVVADECAPAAVRASWERVYRAPAGASGRPRLDRTAPPPELAARTWGRAALGAALAAWVDRAA